MSLDIKFEYRHFQLLDLDGVPYWCVGDSPDRVETTYTQPSNFNGNWQTSDESDITFGSDNGVPSPEDLTLKYGWNEGKNGIKNELKNEIGFKGKTAKFISDWITYENNILASENIIEIRITDKQCGKLLNGNYLIRPQNINKCKGECNVMFTMEAYDPKDECMNKFTWSDKRTNIRDTEHRFYCYGVDRGNTNQLWQANLFNFSFSLIVGFFGGIISALIDVIPGLTAPDFIPTLQDFEDNALETVGLGRGHVGVKIKQILEQSGELCGFGIDENSIFCAAEIKNPETGELEFNPYKDADLICADSKKGRKRDSIKKLFMRGANRPVETISQLLEKLSKHFNQKWYCKGGKLIIKTDWCYDAPIFNFDEIEKEKIIDELCTESSQNANSNINITYCDDGVTEAKDRYNAQFFIHRDKPSPNKTETFDCPTEIGLTRFIGDGVEEDYINEATTNTGAQIAALAILTLNAFILLNAFLSINVAIIGALTTLAIGIFAIIGVNVILNAFDYRKCIYLKGKDTLEWCKIVIPEPNTDPCNAKPVTAGNGSTLEPNECYNTDNEPYEAIHPDDISYELCNYPMYFDPYFKRNAFWYFWQNKFKGVPPEQKITFTIKGCCEFAELLGLFEGGEIAIDETFTYCGGRVGVIDCIEYLPINGHIKIEGHEVILR